MIQKKSVNPSIKTVQSQALIGLLAAAGVPVDLLNSIKQDHDWSKYNGVMIPASVLKDICLTLGIDQLKDRQNFRNWIKEVTSLKGIPEGKLTLLTRRQAQNVIQKCLTNLSKTSTEGYKTILNILSENILFDVLETGQINRMLIRLPTLLETPTEKRIETNSIVFPGNLIEEELIYLKPVVPKILFTPFVYSVSAKIEATTSNYLLEHIRDICTFIGLNLVTDTQLVNKWLCKSAGIGKLADSKGLTLLSFDQAVEVIGIGLCRLVKIYTGQRIYVGKDSVSEELKTFAYDIMMRICSEPNTLYSMVLSKTSPTYQPNKRLKGGKILE